MSVADPRRRGKERSAVPISPADEAILHALIAYHQLTPAQICRLFYSPKSLTWVEEKLRRLRNAEVILEHIVPTIRGERPHYYTVARKGLNYLASKGNEVPCRFRRSEQQEGYQAIYHTIAVNDTLMLLVRLFAQMPAITLLRWRHERHLNREPFHIPIEGKAARFSPDGLFDLSLSTHRHMHLLIEVDRGTEEQKVWRAKVRRLLAYVLAHYPKRKSKKRQASIAVVATKSWRHAERLQAWTESQLRASRAMEYGDIFRFAHLHADQVTPQQAYLSPSWLMPFSVHRVPLPIPGPLADIPAPLGACCALPSIDELQAHTITVRSSTCDCPGGRRRRLTHLLPLRCAQQRKCLLSRVAGESVRNKPASVVLPVSV